MRVVLGSGSPRRRELLAHILPSFEVRPADVDETLTEKPREDAARLAIAKARAGLELDPSAVVIGADTIVADATRSYGKPRDSADAVEMLRDLAGRPHLVLTGVAIAVEGWSPIVAVSETVVEMVAMDEPTIAAYVASGRPLDKAGAYAIQDEDVPTVERWHGCYCGVMGLPLWLTRELLYEYGVEADAPLERLARCAMCPERTGVIE